MLERYVETYVNAGVGAERDKLLAHLAQDVVHADEDVEALGVSVDHPSAAGCEAVHGEAHATVEPAQRSHVGTHTTLGPCVFAVEACGAERTELQLTIEREHVFCAKVERGTYAGGTSALVALVSKVGEVGYLVRLLVALTLERVVLEVAVVVILIIKDVVETAELEALLLVHSRHIVAPADEAEVEK